MNLCACLGVGPGHVLLLGPLTPGVEYRKPRTDAWHIPAGLKTAQPRKPRVRRNAEEARALRRRVLERLSKGEQPIDVARAEKIDRTHVLGIAREAGQRRQRTKAEVDAIVAKALRLSMQFPSMKQKDVAAQCGVTPSYLSLVLQRRAA